MADYESEHAPEECTICEPTGCICACHGDPDQPNRSGGESDHVRSLTKLADAVYRTPDQPIHEEEEWPSDDDMVPCTRCGSWRLPPSWYKPGMWWLGHSTPCIGADRAPDQPNRAWRDRQGDVWTLGEDGLMHAYETAAFPREHVERKWGPLTPCESPNQPNGGE